MRHRGRRICYNSSTVALSIPTANNRAVGRLEAFISLECEFNVRINHPANVKRLRDVVIPHRPHIDDNIKVHR